ncbi:hypothetical protein TNCV_457161 [Trichonephila clavipes]|nr:hypothetical protein TNCV_457161 [Trichonephila clavipes]
MERHFRRRPRHLIDVQKCENRCRQPSCSFRVRNDSKNIKIEAANCVPVCQTGAPQSGKKIDVLLSSDLFSVWFGNSSKRSSSRRFVEWAQNEIAVVPNFHKRILFSDEAHFWLNGYVNKQNCRIWSEANPQVYVETPLHPEKLTVWCALWAGGILLQKR